MIFSRITYWMKGYDTEQQKQSCQNQEGGAVWTRTAGIR